MRVQANCLIILVWLVPEPILLLSNIVGQFEMASSVFDMYSKMEWRQFIINSTLSCIKCSNYLKLMKNIAKTCVHFFDIRQGGFLPFSKHMLTFNIQRSQFINSTPVVWNNSHTFSPSTSPYKNIGQYLLDCLLSFVNNQSESAPEL